MLFELKDRKLCSALPDQQILLGINIDQITLMRSNRNKAIDMSDMRKNQTFPDMVVPKLSPTTFEDFDLAFTGAVKRQIGMTGIALDYLLRENEVGIYNANLGKS